MLPFPFSFRFVPFESANVDFAFSGNFAEKITETTWLLDVAANATRGT
jgi:hypothetical protein